MNATHRQADLTVVIVSWNTCDLLVRCLTALAGDLDHSPGMSVETFVVDNASTDSSPRTARQLFPWAHLIENCENVGFARANNQAIRQSHGRYILLLNSDTQVCQGTLKTLIAFMDTHPAAAAAGAQLLNADGSLQLSCHPMLTPGREFWRLVFLDRLVHKATYSPKRWNTPMPQRVEVIKGACLLLRREALDQVGLLDESYFMYTEEVDLCYRFAHAGWQLWWVPTATVIHYGEASSHQVAQPMYLQLYRSKVQFYRKFGGARQADSFKRLVRLAYGPRLIAATLAAAFSPVWATRASTYRSLLTELARM